MARIICGKFTEHLRPAQDEEDIEDSTRSGKRPISVISEPMTIELAIAFLGSMDQAHTMAIFLVIVGGRGAKAIREKDVVFDSRCKVIQSRCQPKNTFVDKIDVDITDGVLEGVLFVTDGVRHCADMLEDGTLRYAKHSAIKADLLSVSKISRPISYPISTGINAMKEAFQFGLTPGCHQTGLICQS